MKIVLVHGGWQGGWAWDAVAAHLREAGHDVFAPTLRGLEDGSVDRAGITLTTMVDDLVAQLSHCGFDRYVLVGHSGGGPVIQLVTERLRDRVERTVFVDAWVLLDGECINDVLPAELVAGVRALAEQSSDNTIDLPPALWSASFMQDAEEDTLAAVAARLVPTPFGWFTEPVRLTGFFGAPVPSSYVYLLDDQAVPQSVYQAAAARLADPRVVECAGSHEAMLTHPAELAEALVKAIA
ncbi:alpha/beta hydrolase [Amycolatopsis rhabdoformis]|uniref:Alpha/beta hydrolase n=1 Tax=Amycolatopsis rhabdoformis TaxID=1448059 RepID=A0ABZ1HYD2_9PSEU|nr:alpha/beta hydrolase [Amycolatopsis rhabdoformis]WSE27179.1 alpha/beta hydrolase [Amycolatopsis rhabdoformis]